MKLDSLELKNVAAAGATPPRFDMYSGIHKALRAVMADTLLALGRMDTDDDLEVAQVTQRVIELAGFCASHLQHENDFVHAAIEARAPGASAAIAHEHEDHLRHIARLSDAAASVRALAAAERPAPALALYRELSLFIAENFQHMHVEETAHNAVLWARYTDAELLALHDALVASIPPEEMMVVARWMLPFMTPAERLAVLTDMRAKAPPPAFEAILGVLQAHLDARAWSKLAAALGRPAVPGLAA